MKKVKLFYSLPAIAISTFLVIAIIYAWSPPTQSPPGGNVSAPVNVGDSLQIKSGGLGVGGPFGVANEATIGNFRIASTSDTELGVYDSGGNLILIFDEGTP